MKTILKLSFITTLAVLFVLALLRPFGIDQIKEHHLFYYTVEVVCVFSSSLVSLLLARNFFGVDLDKADSKPKLYKGLAVYHLINLPILSLILLTFHAWFYCGTIRAGWFLEDGSFTLCRYVVALIEVSIVSAILFVLHAYMLRNTQLLQELEELRAINTLLEKRQEEYAEQQMPINDEKGEEETPEPAKCVLVGNTKSAVLEVAPADIVYIESMQNYADVCYMAEGQVAHKTLRITLKQLHETLSGATNIVSPHRAFLVNLDFVVAVGGQSNLGYHLQMFGMDKEIPVSRTNIRTIKERLSGEVKN